VENLRDFPLLIAKATEMHELALILYSQKRYGG
jgi:hypothetical protein